MHINPVSNSTFIVRCQAEYSAATRTVIVRCILERSGTGQHRSFGDMQALLAALQADVTAMQNGLWPAEQEQQTSAAHEETVA